MQLRPLTSGRLTYLQPLPQLITPFLLKSFLGSRTSLMLSHGSGYASGSFAESLECPVLDIPLNELFQSWGFKSHLYANSTHIFFSSSNVFPEFRFVCLASYLTLSFGCIIGILNSTCPKLMHPTHQSTSITVFLNVSQCQLCSSRPENFVVTLIFSLLHTTLNPLKKNPVFPSFRTYLQCNLSPCHILPEMTLLT